MDRTSIIGKVQVALDEINGLSEGQTIMDAQIEGQLNDSAVSLLMLLPSFLCVTEHIEPTVTTGKFEAPTDYLKISHVESTGWDIPVTVPVPNSHKRVAMETIPYFKATPNNPLLIMEEKDGKKIFTPKPYADADVISLYYVERPAAAEDVDDRYIDMLAWHTAERILSAYSETQKVQVCRARLEELIQTATTWL